MEQKNKTIYYTVEIELDYFDEIGTTNGLRNISLYIIKNNKVLMVGELKSFTELMSSEEEISDYIDEFLPEYDSNLIELVRL